MKTKTKKMLSTGSLDNRHSTFNNKLIADVNTQSRGSTKCPDFTNVQLGANGS
jgi:hypothetical protein